MFPAAIPLVLVALLVAACGTASQVSEGVLIEVHRSAECSCCAVYEDYLVSEGFDVRTVLHPDGGISFKRSVGVPDGMFSCHTSTVGGYFVEGHVPAADIRKLLAEAPDVSGIALPGMPPGSPGMGGTALEPLKIFAVGEGEPRVFSER